MKKIKSSVKKDNIKSFILGIALAIVISFGIVGVFAQQGSDHGNEPREAWKFIGQEGVLINKIGSLSIGSDTDAPWIYPGDSNSPLCLTINPDTNEKESCLSVVGGPASFSKLTVLDMPAFIQGGSLFLNDDGNKTFLSNLSKGLVIDDFTGDDDSMLVSTLQYEVGGNIAPRNLDERRNLCAEPATGRLVVCAEPVYHWELDQNGLTDCGLNEVGYCTGTYTTTEAGSCTGTYDTYSCDGTYSKQDKIDWYGALKNWTLGVAYRYDESTAYVSGHSGNYPKYKGSTHGGSTWSKKNCGLCTWNSTSLPLKKMTYNIDCSIGATDESSCEDFQRINNGATSLNRNGHCSWNTNSNQCSSLGAGSESSCEASPHQSCEWQDGAGSSHDCSDITSEWGCRLAGGSSECTWHFPTGSQEHTYLCKDDSGNTVSDSFCSDLSKPANSSQDCKADAVCGTGSSCDVGARESNFCRGLAEDGCTTGGDESCVGDDVQCN